MAAARSRLDPHERPPVTVGLNAVILAVTEDEPRVLTVRRAEHSLADGPPRTALRSGEPAPALPFGPLDPERHRTLELGLRSWVREQTGLDLGYVEQLYTFGDRDRVPPKGGRGSRVLSVAYLALVREGKVAGAGEARWLDCYDLLPWEDWRRGRPAVIDEAISPALAEWAAAAGDAMARRHRRERVDITFGLGSAGWDHDRVLDRYELLYEVGMVAEAWRGREVGEPSGRPLGAPMVLDHRRILATALGRTRGKLRYRPVVFELVPATFTLFQLQKVVEALAGVPLHKPNFRRLLERGRLVEGTGRVKAYTGGRPAELFRFRRDVLRERRAPGVGLPPPPGP